MSVKKVKISSDVYMVCLHHAFTTEAEEVMGLLIGQYNTVDDETTCDILSAITLRRSDKKRDRVEISPEMLFEAQQKTEQMSALGNQELHIVGWYHSHPHITVWPSRIDLQTQAGYQQMDNRFIGLIFSAFHKDKKSKVGSHQLTCFQAVNKNRDDREPLWERVSVPFQLVPTGSISANNQQAIESLIMALFEEQNEVLEKSKEKLSQYPLALMHNSAVMVRNVCALNQGILGPLVASVEKELNIKQNSMRHLKDEVEYLKKLLKDHENESTIQ